MSNRKKERKYSGNDIISIVGYSLLIVLLIGGFIYGFVHDRSQNKKYGKPKYEFVITDKYEDLGSTWHLVGGRATEQTYHIVYCYRLTNRPDRDDNMKWYSSETTVSGNRYRKLEVGQTLCGNSMFFPY